MERENREDKEKERKKGEIREGERLREKEKESIFNNYFERNIFVR